MDGRLPASADMRAVIMPAASTWPPAALPSASRLPLLEERLDGERHGSVVVALTRRRVGVVLVAGEDIGQLLN